MMFKKFIERKLVEYFDVERDTYYYILTRDKSAFQFNTMKFDDFKEFNKEIIDDIVNYIFEDMKLVDEEVI